MTRSELLEMNPTLRDAVEDISDMLDLDLNAQSSICPKAGPVPGGHGRAFRAQSPLVVQFAAYFPYFPKANDGFLYLFLSGFVIGFAVIFFAT